MAWQWREESQVVRQQGYTQIRDTTWFEEDIRDRLPNTQDLLI